MNKKFRKPVWTALAIAALAFHADAAGFTDTFHDTYRRNSLPTPRALNLAAKMKAAENDALRLAQKIAALQRPTITAYSNIAAPEPPAVAAVPSAVAPNVINITGSNVVINQ